MDFKLGVHQSLVQVSTAWNFSADQHAELLEKKMIDFMKKENGIGLAANQVGITKRVFVMGSGRIPDFPLPFAVFNPQILETSKGTTSDREGCLSYPGLFLTVKRPSWIIAEYQNSRGDIIEAQFEGYLSKCFQHELDHLDGICFVDKVSPMKLNLAMKKFRKIHK